MKIYYFDSQAQWDSEHQVAVIASSIERARTAYEELFEGKKFEYSVTEYELKDGSTIQGGGYDATWLEISS